MNNKLIQLAIAFTCLFSIQSFAQDAQPTEALPSSNGIHSFVKAEKIVKFYTKDELNKLNKLELIDIYKSRLVYLIEILPFISLHPAPGATFRDMAIPETEANIGHLEKESKNKQDFIKSLSSTLDDVIPYSEKTNIIWAILYFDEMIKKSEYIEKSK